MGKLSLLIPLICGLLFAGCQHVPKISISWPASELTKEISELKKEKEQLFIDLDTKIAVAKEEGRKLQEDRYSKGTANVYAAHSSIKAEPEPSKFVTAADQLLDSAKTALPIPKVEDLQAALAIKDKLISEQAELIKEGQSELQKQRETILAAKNKEAELQAEQEKLKATAKAKEKELIAQIEIKESQLEKERLAWAIKAEKDAAKWRYENVWYRKYNPLRHLGNFFSSILFWVIFVLVGGLILKILSVIFPGVSVIQSVVRGIGKTIGALFGMLFRWIPDALDGAGVVDKQEHKLVVIQRDNSIGAIANYREENPEDYKNKLKPKLLDWNRDAPKEVLDGIQKRLEELNQV